MIFLERVGELEEELKLLNHLMPQVGGSNIALGQLSCVSYCCIVLPGAPRGFTHMVISSLLGTR